MIINQQRINKLDAHLDFLDDNTEIIVGLENPDRYEDTLEKVGFNSDLEVGDRLLPPKSFGSVSEFNAEGGEEIHDDQPKETVYHARIWEWKEWHGDKRVPQSKIIYRPYERYPRTPIDPPGVEFTVKKVDGSFYLTTPPIEYNSSNQEEIKHRINLFLEIFEECHVFDDDLDPLIRDVDTNQLNWELLPPGEYPWSKVRGKIESNNGEVSDEKMKIFKHRHDTIHRLDPDEVYQGQAGFSGYLLFVFDDADVCVCESIYYGNALYVFDQDSRQLTRLTKSEILNGDLHKDRIIHRGNWREKLKEHLE